MISVRAPVGDVNVATEHCGIGRGLAAIRPGPDSDPWFLYFALLYSKPALEFMATGSTFASINKNTLNSLDIPFFDRLTQAAIGRFLHSLVYRIEQEDEAVRIAQVLKRAVMQTLFTRGLRGESQKETEIGRVPESWKIVSVGTVRERLQYGTSTRCSYEPTEFPVLRIPNIEPSRIDDKDLKFCRLQSTEAARYRLKDGDLIFIRTNGVVERLGACAIYTGRPENALFASYLIRVSLKLDQVDPHFMAYFFGSELGTSVIAGRATPAADGKYNLNTGTINVLPLPLPPTLEEQREIVAILDAIDRKIYLHQKKRAVLDDLFKGLLHKLMTGKVRVGELGSSAFTSMIGTSSDAES